MHRRNDNKMRVDDPKESDLPTARTSRWRASSMIGMLLAVVLGLVMVYLGRLAIAIACWEELTGGCDRLVVAIGVGLFMLGAVVIVAAVWSGVRRWRS